MPGTAYRLVAPQRGDLVPIDDPIAGVGEVVLRVLHCGVCASELPVWSAPRDDYPLRLGRRQDRARVRALDPAADDVAQPECGAGAGGHHLADRPGDSVAVIGTGFMGLVMVQLLATSAISRFVVVDPRADARAAGIANGAEEATAPSEVDGEFDVVVEASGTQPGLDLATRLAREHGTICALGYHQADRSVDMEAWNRKALDVVNGHVRDRRLLREATAAGLRLQAHGRLDIARLVTHRFRLDSVDTGLQALRDKPEGFIKGVVDVGV